MPFLGLLDAFPGERGARHSGLEHRPALLLEPGFQQVDLGRPPHAVRALDDDKPAGQVGEVHPGQHYTVSLSHGATLDPQIPQITEMTRMTANFTNSF